jgi:hypothetical protein
MGRAQGLRNVPYDELICVANHTIVAMALTIVAMALNMRG